MPLQRPPDEGGSQATGGRPVVLLTGGAGVVGGGVLKRLQGAVVIALVHRTPVEGPGVTALPGDVGASQLGLSTPSWSDLARRVDAVVHAAAVTDFSGDSEHLERANIEGTRHVLELAAAADAPLYHLSTAYIHADIDTDREPDRGRMSVRYAATKRVGDELVRNSGLPHTILRPSVVTGDARTGETTAFQGVHKVADAIVRGEVPLLPFDPDWRLDTIPRDIVADAVCTLVERQHVGGELWLTSGSRALTVRESVDALVEMAAAHDRVVPQPRFVSPETFDRLIAPVFLDALPAQLVKTMTRMLDSFSAYLAHSEPMPSSLPALVELGVQPLPDPARSLRASFAYWLRATGLGAARGGAGTWRDTAR